MKEPAEQELQKEHSTLKEVWQVRRGALLTLAACIRAVPSLLCRTVSSSVCPHRDTVKSLGVWTAHPQCSFLL